MSTVHTPQAKKQLSYDRDHRVRGKNDKAFRRKWPLKKRKASRSFRHAAESLTRTAAANPKADIDLRLIKKPQLTKWGVTSLRSSVTKKLKLRTRRVGAKIERKKSREKIGTA